MKISATASRKSTVVRSVKIGFLEASTNSPFRSLKHQYPVVPSIGREGK